MKIDALESMKEWGMVFLILGVLLSVAMGVRFYSFEHYVLQKEQRIQARVLAQYLKGDKWVLKLKAENGLMLYVTSKEKLKDLQNRHISLFGKPAKCDFFQSFRSCFFIAFSIDLLPKTWRNVFYDYVDSQHTDKLISKLYQTLFFASNLPKEWRDLASSLKVTHLLAISGLHLGILAFVFYVLFSPLYQIVQERYFTYRNRLFDIGLALNCFLLGYLVLLDFPPSFVRAYVMSVLGFLFVYWHFSLLNFSFLFLGSCLILVLFPEFFVSIGFWFSVCGVFYIFLFFKYFSFEWVNNRWMRGIFVLCALNFILFFNMLPLTHLIFPSFSPLSILAIPLSIMFVPFFVIALLLHIFSVGWVLDGALIEALKISFNSVDIVLVPWFGALYIGISLLGIKFRSFYLLSLVLGVMIFVYFCAHWASLYMLNNF